MAKDYKIFISHSWDNEGDLIALKRLLNERGYFKVTFKEVTKDTPINSSYANYIKSVLSSRIEESDIVIGLAGVYASYSDWMIWELDKAISKRTPIIGVVPRGQERVSSEVRQRAIELVRWNTESIVQAIKNHSK